MGNEPELHKQLLGRSFEKAAAGYGAAAVLQHEVGRRMLSGVDYIKHQPASVLDAGTGTGNVIAALRARYPRAALYALDIALAMVQRVRSAVPWSQRVRRRGVLPVCGDIEQLPFRTGAVEMVWSNI